MSFDNQMIGNRIRKAREDKGITQEILAESMDVSNAYISKIERGRTPVNLDNLDKICAVLETSPEYILHGTNTSTDEYMRNEIIDMLQGCSAEKIKLIAQVIKPIVEYKG
ncbi:helix-turn-helix domain-containing protein [Cohnella kolymensis]|nr:helix-turn-helix transcriptional regulator [Cohnella kolymensis]